MPLSLKFFLGFQSSAEQTLLPIQMEARIGDYLNLVITLCFAFGLCFELPVLLLLLAKLGFIKAAQLRAIRRYVIVIVLTIAAVLTPPDLLSQILLAIPLYALYEISVLCVAWMERHALSNPPIDATQNDEF
jgi:sec-independent protein translocase protein TatC